MSSFLRQSTLKRLFPALLVAGGFLILWLGVLGDLTASVDAALSSSTHLQQISQEGAVCEIEVSSQPTMTYGTVQAGVDKAQAGDELTVIGTCTGTGMAPIALITKSLTLRGEGGAVLEGQNARRLLYITGDIDVTVENLELRGGKAIGNGVPVNGYGGGLYVTTGTVTLRNSLITSNTASNGGGGLYAEDGNVILENNSQVFNNRITGAGEGGGLYVVTGTLTLNNTSLENNRADSGGGVYLGNSTAIFKGGSNLAQNQATSGDGGGVLAHYSVMTLTNSSLVTNTAQYNGGGLYADNHNTITLMGGSEVAANEAILGTGGAVHANQGAVTLNGIIVANHVITAHGAALYLDVLEANLKDNVLIENKSREGSGGALYLKATKAEFSGNLINNNQAESHGGGFWLKVGEITIEDNTFLANKSLEGRGGALHLEVTGSTEADLSGNIINNNEAKLDGGGFSLRNIDDGVLLSNNEFNSNKALTANGGALYLYNSNATLNNNNLTANQADNNGGGLYAHSNSEVTLENDNELLNNSATSGSGGGLYLNSGNATINDNKISGNSAHIHGGGYYANNDANALNGNTFSGNNAQTGHGGGLYVKGTGAATLSENRIEQNKSLAGRGGGMYIVEVDARISDSHIIGNEAIFGGGLFLSLDSSIVSNNIITDNKSSHGGGFFLSNSSAKLIKNQIMTNTASDGGGIFLSESSQAEVKENVIAHNVGNSAGGGLYLELSDATIYHNQISTNTVVAATENYLEPFLIINNTNSGGGLFLTESNAKLERNTIQANKAGNGGALYLSQSAPTAINNIIVDNQATIRASALYNVASSPSFKHNTIANNSGGQNGYALFVTQNESSQSTLRMTNTILSNHNIALYVEAGNTAILRNSLWYNNQDDSNGLGTIDTAQNIVGNPHFTATQAGNYRLAANSAAIDVGVNAGINQDIDLEPRPTYPTQYDIGADEYYNPKVSLDYQVTPNPVLAGEYLTYTVDIRNIGNVFLTATIKVDLPNVVTPHEINPWTDIPLNPVSPNNRWREKIRVRVNSNYQGSLRSVAEVTTEQGATVPITVTSQVRPASNEKLVLSYNAMPNPVVSGKVLTYNLAVTNTHNADIYGTINITLPTNVRPTGVISWPNIHLISNTVWMPSKPITVTVNNNYEGPLISTLEVTSQGGGLSNDKDVIVTATTPVEQFDLTAAPSFSLTQKDQQLIYQFRVTNTGNTTLYSPTITIITAPSTATSGEIFTETDQLEPDQVWIGSVSTMVTTELYQFLTSTITAYAQNAPAKSLVKSVEANVIQIKQVATPTHPLPGGLITYTLYITNRSHSVPITATIKDELPQQVILLEGSENDPPNISIAPGLSVTKMVTGTLISGCLVEPLTNIVRVTSNRNVSNENRETTYPLHLATTITATKSGAWDEPLIWSDSSLRKSNRIPQSSDRVYIPKGVVVTAPDTIQVKSLNNLGTLQSQAGTLLDINATSMLCNNGKIIAFDLIKRSHSSSDIQLKAPLIENQGEIIAGEGIIGSNAGGSLLLEGDVLLNSGTLRAGNGGNNAKGLGGVGGSITIMSLNGLISSTEASEIQSGNGGTGERGGGDGGIISLMAKNMSIEGEIQSGDGGNILLYRFYISGGNGGDIKLFGNNQQANNCSEIMLSADITSGNGGNISPSSVTQKGGNSGGIYLMSAPALALQDSKITVGQAGSIKNAISGTPGERAPLIISDGKGKDSCTSEPKITLANSGTQLNGQDITIFGDDNLLLDLSNMELPIASPLAISATGSVLLATGANGRIDLRGNLNQIIKSDSDSETTLAVTNDNQHLLLSTGLQLSSVAGDNATAIEPKLLRGVSLVAPDPVRGNVNVPITISLALINRGVEKDTFNLTTKVTGTTKIQLEQTKTVLGNQIEQLNARITPGFSYFDIIEIHAISQNDPTQESILKLRIIVDEDILFLPLITTKPIFRNIYLPILSR